MERNGQKQYEKNLLTIFSISREEGQLKGRTPIGGFAEIYLLAVLLIFKLYMHDITVSDILNFLVPGILIWKMLFFLKWKRNRFVFYLTCRTIAVMFEMFFFCLWNSQGNYAIKICINRWKLITFTWTNTSIKSD